MNRVFVLSNQKQPLMSCKPARARLLLRKGKAAVYRRQPFTIILKERETGEAQPIEFKADPGSKTTGLALVALFEHGREPIWAANLQHRGHSIKSSLDSRRAIRRGRRNRKTRYRPARFNNRTRPQGWLPPSLVSRVKNVENWAARLTRLSPVSEIAVETVRFDSQIMQNPDIEGVQYQQGTLFGTELREYLLYRHNHTCAYCGGQSGDPILEREHIHPRSKGGSNRVSNQVIACRCCNEAKGNKYPDTWLSELKASRKRLDKIRATNLGKILQGIRPSMRDMAAVNATRYAIGDALKSTGLPTTFWSGGRTKFNRTNQGYKKDHWIDAACVGETGELVEIPKGQTPLQITALGRGSRQMCRVDRYGFPRTKPKKVKRVQGFQTGDLAHLVQPGGKYAGAYTGRVSVRERGDFDISVVLDGKRTKITAPAHRYTLLQRDDGYAYAK